MKYLVHETRRVINQIEKFEDSKVKETDLIESEVEGYSVETIEPNEIVFETEYLGELLNFLLENDQEAVENGEYGSISDNGYGNYLTKELLKELKKHSYWADEESGKEAKEHKSKCNAIEREILRRCKNDT